MIKVNDNVLPEANEIVNKGLLKAAESLSFFMKEKISLAEMDYNYINTIPSDSLIYKNGDNLHLLITEIIGELKGVCCLIFSEDEANKLRQTALPPEIINNPDIMREMSDGILLEVDNIISASVITQFSNILKCKIYGDVPRIKKLNTKEVNEYVKDKLQGDMFVISFNTHFVSENLDFSPQFLWLFDEAFINSINNTLNKVD